MRRCCRLQRRSQRGTAAPLVPYPRVTPLWREQLQRGRRRAICRGQQRVCQRVAERGAGGAQRGARAAHGRAGSRGAATQHTLHATQAAQPRWLRRRARATSEGVRRCLLGTLACRPTLLLLCGIQAACSAPRRPLCATRSPHPPLSRLHRLVPHTQRGEAGGPTALSCQQPAPPPQRAWPCPTSCRWT